MRSCREVTRLASLAKEQPLTFMQKIELKFHLFVCKRCAEFNAKMSFVSQSMTEFAQGRNEKK